MISRLSCRMGWKGFGNCWMGKYGTAGDLTFRLELEWDGNGIEVIEMGRNLYEKSIPAHL